MTWLSPRTIRRPKAFCGALLTIRLVILISALAGPYEAQAQEIATALTLNSIVRQSIRGGESHSYKFESQERHYARLAIGRSTANILVSVVGPDGRQVVSLDCRRCDSMSLSFITVKAGGYRVSVRSSEAKEVTGQYDIRLAEGRPQAASDHTILAAERNLAAAAALPAKLHGYASRQAIGKYRKALLNSRMAGDRRGRALALRAMGDTYRMLGELDTSVDCYKQAYDLASEEPRLRAGAALGLSYTHLLLGNIERAWAQADEALKLNRQAGDRAGEALALVCVGDAHHDMGRPEKALAYYRDALIAAREGKDRAAESLALLNIGYALSDLGDKFEALDFLTQSLAGWRVLGELLGQAKTLAALGTVSSGIGEKQKALDYYGQAAQLLQARSEPASEAAIYAGTGYVYEGLGEQEAALENYLKSLASWKTSKYRKAEAEALAQVARLYLQKGEMQLAHVTILQAKRLSRGIKDDSLEGFIAIHLGQIYRELGRQDEALTVYENALKASRACRSLWTEAQALNGIGDIYFQSGDHAGAIKYYDKALEANRKLHDVSWEVTTLCKIARSQSDAGEYALSLTRLEEALEKIESLREKVVNRNLRAAYFATVRDAYELTIDAHVQLSKRERGGKHAKAAFVVSEHARARSLLDRLREANIDMRQGIDPAILEQERSLLAKINTQEDKLAKLYTANLTQQLAEKVELELMVLLDSYEAVQSQMRAQNHRYATLTDQQPVTLADTQQLLDDNTILLEYTLGEKRSYLWAISNLEVSIHELPGRAALDAMSRRFHALITSMASEAECEAEAARIGQVLVAPVAAKVAGKRLVIIPDGALHYVPFAALSVSATDTKQHGQAVDYRPLIADHEIVYLPSVATLLGIRNASARREQASMSLALFADPVFNRGKTRSEYGSRFKRRVRQASRLRSLRSALDRAGTRNVDLSQLPSSKDEADAIIDAAAGKKIFQAIGLDANLGKLKGADLSQYSIIHFATHGLIDASKPALSSLVLSLVDGQGASQNGFLRLHDIYNLNLRADLVVLSACETALGKEISGEGLVGLTRGFMHAGASRVIASLWKIDDTATAELMKKFYIKMLRKDMRPATALREAQLEISQQRRWRSPFFWAPFLLQGELD